MDFEEILHQQMMNLLHATHVLLWQQLPTPEALLLESTTSENLQPVEEKHQCTVCGECFQDVGTLSTHMLTHADFRKFLCEYCGQRFQQNADRNKHILIHKGVRPHQCPVCDKSFVQSNNMLRHVRQVHGNNISPFVCKFCGVGFKKKLELRRHHQFDENCKRLD